MTTLRTAAQQALEACKLIVSAFDALKPASDARNEPLQINAARASITALEAALAEPVQEPAFHGFMSADGTRVDLCFTPGAPRADGVYATAYYTAPPKRPAEAVQEPETVDQRVVPLVESALQAVAEKIGDQCAVWYGIGARDVEEVLREAARHGLVHGALAEPVQEPATLPGPGLVMCPACCAQFDPALNSVQPVQEPGVWIHPWPPVRAQQAEPAQKTEMRRCPRCWEPMFPPQPTPLTVERLRDALVASRIVPPAAVEDPDEYDDGVTLYRIEALHRRLA